MKATIICFSGHGTTGVVSGAPIGATIIHTKSLRMRWYIWLRSILALSLSLNTRRWTESKENPHYFLLAMVYLVTIHPCFLLCFMLVYDGIFGYDLSSPAAVYSVTICPALNKP